jgi:ABC-type lipoprotein release transport system permease subunit
MTAARTVRTATAGVALGVAAVVGLTACGSSGTEVYQRKSNSNTNGVVLLQAGNYELDLSCTDKRTSRKVNGKKRKSGSTPTVSISTLVNGQQVETDASCTGSDSQKFTIAGTTELRVDTTVNGSATYVAKVLKK